MERFSRKPAVAAAFLDLQSLSLAWTIKACMAHNRSKSTERLIKSPRQRWISSAVTISAVNNEPRKPAIFTLLNVRYELSSGVSEPVFQAPFYIIFCR